MLERRFFVCACQLMCNLAVLYLFEWKIFAYESENKKNLEQGMIQKIIQVLILTAFLFTSYHRVIGSDDDESFYFANGNNNKFFFNTRKNCQPNYYFDVEYFKCRLCDGNFNLMTNELSEFEFMLILINLAFKYCDYL
jgi:hypothetical protein